MSQVVRKMNKLFLGVDESIVKRIYDNSQIIEYKKGDYIHFDGDVCDSLDYIQSGEIEIEHLTEEGLKKTMNIYKKFDVLGLNIMYSSNQYYIMNFVAHTDASILQIKRDDLTIAIKESEQLLMNVLNHLSNTSMFIGTKLKKDFKVTIREQLLNLIFSQFEKQKKNPIKLPYSKTKIAEIFGVSRTSISRELTRMIKEGIIEMDRDFIIIKKK